MIYGVFYCLQESRVFRNFSHMLRNLAGMLMWIPISMIGGGRKRGNLMSFSVRFVFKLRLSEGAVVISDREIALEQALVAAFGAAAELGIDHDTLCDASRELIQRYSKYVKLNYPHVDSAQKELMGAWEQFKAIEGK
ncbi:hypothetical protein [Pseudomonas sp. H1h]|uniref:hypothetical protein n=1 Tax=Pseudomonas sp. H1h TaxID=1397280 RepID=UPI0006767FA6|nr:hypothetical protein [Pseudomonas sp. H1h]